MTDLQKLKELALAAQKVSYHSDTGMLFNHEAAKALPALIAEHEAALDKIDALESELSHCRGMDRKEQDK